MAEEGRNEATKMSMFIDFYNYLDSQNKRLLKDKFEQYQLMFDTNVSSPLVNLKLEPRNFKTNSRFNSQMTQKYKSKLVKNLAESLPNLIL